MIRAAIFDLWGTLLHTPEGDPYRSLQARVPADRQEAFWAFKRDAMVREDLGVEALLMAHAGDLGLSGEALEGALERFRALPSEAIPFPDALEALQETRSVARTALLTNTHAEGIEPLLESAGLRPHLGSLFLSARTGHLKPSADAFRTVQQKLGLFPGQLLMVGDSWTDDIQGALEAGWTAVWVNRSGQPRPPHEDEESLVEITHLGQVPEVVRNLQAGARCSTCLG